MTRKVEVQVREDGGLWLHIDGRAVQPGAKVTLTAGEIAVLVRDHTWAGIVAGRRVGSRATATVALRAGASAIRATAQAGAQAAAQPAFDAGARYAAQAIAKSTRIRRTVERDKEGRITGIVESREPVPSPTTKGKT